MAKTYKIKDGKIIVNEEIAIVDYAVLLKYDKHLYNLPNDIKNAKDARFRNYLKKAKELFAEEVSKAKPNKRVDLFGAHSVFYYLYGHTGDWAKAAREEAVFFKDLLVCVSNDSVDKTLDIIRKSSSQAEAGERICKTFGINASSSAKILSLTVNQLLGLMPSLLEKQYNEAIVFQQRITELEQYDSRYI